MLVDENWYSMLWYVKPYFNMQIDYILIKGDERAY